MTRVLVARPATAAGEIVARLEASGLEPLCLPLIETRPLPAPGALDSAIAALATYDWVVFASAGSARLFVERARALGVAPGASVRPLVCAGPATADVLASLDWRADRIEAPFSAEGARDALLPLIGAGSRVLLPGAEAGRGATSIAPALRERGAAVDEVTLYRTLPRPEEASTAAGLIAGGEVGALMVFSPSAVRALQAAVETRDAPAAPAAGRGCLPGAVVVGCIGQTTARAAREAGWRVDVVSPDTTGAALAEALIAHLTRRGRRQPLGVWRGRPDSRAHPPPTSGGPPRSRSQAPSPPEVGGPGGEGGEAPGYGRSDTPLSRRERGVGG